MKKYLLRPDQIGGRLAQTKTGEKVEVPCTARLVEAGCSEREVMPVTGHMTFSMLSHYAKGASKKALAAAAVKRLEERSKKAK